MKLSYDATTDTLYVELRPRAGADAEAFGDDFVIDFDETGAVVGIEVQHASAHADLTCVETHDLPKPATADRTG